jgi:hypothetical protein
MSDLLSLIEDRIESCDNTNDVFGYRRDMLQNLYNTFVMYMTMFDDNDDDLFKIIRLALIKCLKEYFSNYSTTKNRIHKIMFMEKTYIIIKEFSFLLKDDEILSLFDNVPMNEFMSWVMDRYGKES